MDISLPLVRYACLIDRQPLRGWRLKEKQLSAALALSILVHITLLLLLGARFDGKHEVVSAPIFQVELVPIASATHTPQSRVAVTRQITSKSETKVTESETTMLRDASALNTVQSQKVADRSQPQSPRLEDYAVVAQLDKSPKPLDDVQLEYPAEALARSGTVVLRLLINERGLVDDAQVVSASPPKLFDEAARRDFIKVHFSPGERFGIAVKSQLTIEVNYTPLDRGGSVEAAR